MVSKINMIGLKFNHLTVICENGKRNNQIVYDCICDCGNTISVPGTRLRNNKTKSCGCLQQEQSESGTKNKKHNMWGTPFYNTWRAMLRRCTDKNFISYKDYGAKGITICDEWLKFENFYSDMYPSYINGYTIERIDNSKNYIKDNCTWLSRKNQPQHASSNKLSFSLVAQIKDLYRYGYSVSDLTAIYNCGDTTIRNCLNGLSWQV